MVDKNFIEAIEKKDLDSIRSMLVNRLHVDHDVTGGMFHECMEYCKQKGISPFQEDDNRTILQEISEQNYKVLIGQLSTNFSKKRVETVLMIAKSLWKNEQTGHESLSLQDLDESTSKTKTFHTSGNERVIGEEKIISETPLYEEKEDFYENKRTRNISNKNNGSDINPLVVVGAVAVVAVAVAIAVAVG